MRIGLKPKKVKWDVDELCIAILGKLAGVGWTLHGTGWASPEYLRKKLKSDGSTFGKALLSLQQRGLVVRLHDKHCKHTRYFMSKKGSAFLEEYRLTQHPPDKRIMDPLSPGMGIFKARRDKKRFPFPNARE